MSLALDILSTLTTADGTSAITYDNNSQITGIADSGGGTLGYALIATSYTFDQNGNDTTKASPMPIKAVIPHKDNEHARTDGRTKFDKASYRRRSIIENVIGWLKECRRVATRFEKLAINFQAMLQLAMIQNCLKIAFSDRA